MKHSLLTVVLTGAVLMGNGCCQLTSQKENTSFPDKKEILCRLKKHEGKKLFPAAAERKGWQKLSPETRQQVIAKAEKALKTPWVMLTARDYMRFMTENSRRAYEVPYFRNRIKLVELVCGECCEYKGRFMDEIIEGLWQILSEPTWCLPAHEGMPEGELFPDPTRFRVDLFSTETGKTLCDVLAVLEKELSQRSPALVLRIKMEVIRRVIEPAEKLNADTAWWFSGRNNWTPWCANNISGSAIYLLKDQPERLAKILDTYLTISRRFYDRYPDDGGCNEGPTYWRQAVGKYLQLLLLLDNRLQLEGRLFRDEKLLKMCEYLPRMNLCSSWFLSTNDAGPRGYFSPGFLALAAQKTRCKALEGLAQRLAALKKKPASSSELEAQLSEIFFTSTGTTVPEKVFAPVDFWPQLGIAIFRARSEAPEKNTVAVIKGGHNGESHNHLDLGHFSIFHKNKPYIIDVGAGVYTGITFGSKRYTLWYLNETGHNPPRFSGKGQVPGSQYRSDLKVLNDSTMEIGLDDAYPEEVGVKTLKRTLVLDRKTGKVTISDTAQVKGQKTVSISLITAVEPVSFDKKSVRWKNAVLTAENIAVKSVAPEKRTDAAITRNWKRLWRIELEGSISETGRWQMEFSFKKP